MRNNKQFVVIFAVLVLTLCVSVPLYFVVPKAEKEAQVALFPMEFSGWTGKDLPVGEEAYEILETRNLIMREYARGEDRVYLYIVYSQDNRKVSHPPEVCLEGSGVTIVHKAKVPLEMAGGETILANELKIEKSGAYNVIWYWYKTGAFFTDNYLTQQIRVALDRLRFQSSSSALIRISVESTPESYPRAEKVLRDFAKEASVHFAQIIP